ncbi:MAG: Hsp20 family protein [Desulforhopalus sp.]|nr:Hsp20 family protein [Desulforhopalus sp.]
MELVPWRLFREPTARRKEMEDLWKGFFGEVAFPRPFGEEWLPAVDISETKDKLVIKAEMPGLDPEDVDVSISADVLTIKGEKKKEKEEKDEHYHCVETYSGSFQRSFRLPHNVQTGKIDATFDKGVLKITLPKTEEAEKKEIKVKTKSK